MKKAITVLLASLPLLAALSLTHATKVRQLNLEEMIDRAGRIVVGVCQSVEHGEEPGFGPVTRITLRVDGSLKGESGDEITLKLPGGQDAIQGRNKFIGLPVFREGEELLLFLYPESSAGFTSPVGFGQGKFLNSMPRNGKVVARNELGNRGLFRNLSASGSRKLAPWTEAGKTVPSEVVDFETLQQMIGELASPGSRASRRGEVAQ